MMQRPNRGECAAAPRFLAVFSLLAGSLCANSASAGGSIDVMVVGNDGAPVPNAVVYLDAVGAEATSAPAGSLITMIQENQQFEPYVLPVQAGTTVAFPNHDPFRHHVYSFSAAKTFELKLYGSGESQSVQFDKPGPVALGCNIHDNMLAYVFVVASPYYAATNAKGGARLADVTAGTRLVKVWHPNQKIGTAPGSTQVEVTDGGSAAAKIAVSVRSDRRSRRAAPYDERGY